MFRKHWWMLALMGILALAVGGCDDSGGGDVDADEEGTIISGKLAQAYVSGAIVIADKVDGSDGLGDFQADPAVEVSTYSEADGSYTLVIPPNYGEYVLCSKGGTVRNSQGARVPAQAMLAPRGTTNLTLVTTLVALHPSLKNKIGQDFDRDIANRNGVPWRILQLAKVAEAYMSVLAEGNDPVLSPVEDEDGFPILAVVELKFNVLEKFARALAAADLDIDNENHIALAVVNAVGELPADPDIKIEDDDRFADAAVLSGILETMAKSVLDAISNQGVVIESAVLLDVEKAVAAAKTIIEGNILAFNPTEQVLPTPNDVVWAESGGNVVFPPPEDDPAAEALYTAVNAMQLKGLSPNTPIAIPLENDTPISADALKRNIRLVNLTALQTMGQASESVVERYEVIQDGDVVKIYPLAPLTPGSKYLVIVLKKTCDNAENGECVFFADENGVMVKEPTLYQFLKFEEPLTGVVAGLEDLRKSYAPIYDEILPLLGMEKDNTLELFTFTTAAKTLSTDDFGLLSAYLAGQGADSLEALTQQIAASDNLPFESLTEEYAAIHNMIPPMTIVAGPNDAETTFVSVNLSSPDRERFGVPCVVKNVDQYQDAVTIYAHGLGGNKESAAGLATQLSMPIIAMDLPHHGDRAAEGVSSGAEYLTLNLPQSRINLYQSYFDMTILLRNIKAGLFNLDGDENVNMPGEPPVDLGDIPAKVYFVGNSMGAITGSVFATYNADMLDRITLSAGGASWAAILDRATNAEITGLVQSLGLERNTVEYFLALGLVQTVMDPADPVWQAGPVIQDKTVLRTAYMDTLVPNVANEVLANAIGWREADWLTEFSGTPPAEPGWYMYGGKEDLAANWIPHGFSYHPDYYPEAAGHFDQAYVEAAGEFAAHQTAAFTEIPSANALAFYPSGNIDQAILPFPNDIAWAASDGKVRLPAPDLMTDPATAALYTAFNALENPGFSPNTPISIPLENSTYISWDSLENNIKLVNLNMLMGVLYGALELGDPSTTPPEQVQEGVMTALAGISKEDVAALRDAVEQANDMIEIWESDLYFLQEDRFIKIYPIEPLAAGSRYLVYILENAPSAEGESGRFVDVNGVPVKSPLLFSYLKSETPLMEPLDDLEPLRQQYQPVFDAILPVLGVEKSNTMELLTFTTADRTLGLDDFANVTMFLGELAAGGSVSLDGLSDDIAASANLPYVNITGNGPAPAIGAEYNFINSQIPPVTAVDLQPGTFISADITSPPENPVQVPVPYTIFNGNSYTGEITIYQHAFFGSKEEGQEVADKLTAYNLPMPVLAMDLPLHGDRVEEAGAPSGIDFLTVNIPQDRINFYQSYFDMTVMLRNLRAGLFNLDGDGEFNLPGQDIVDPDDVPKEINFLGFSGGAILGSVFTTYNSETLDKIVLNHSGANLASIMDRSDTEEMAYLINALGVRKNSLPYFVALGMVQTLLDPADPVYLSDASIVDKTIAQSGYRAIMPPTVSAVIAADTIGFAETSRVTDFVDPLPVEPGHYLLGGKEGLEDNGIPTSFLFEFTVEEGSGVDQAYLDAARNAAWEQIADFLDG